MCVFDYWKAIISDSSSVAFNHILDLEARIRFVVGMIWASVFGVIVAFVSMVFGPYRLGSTTILSAAVLVMLVMVAKVQERQVRKPLLWTFTFVLLAMTIADRGMPALLVFASWCILFAFGNQLRTVRAEEANQTFLAYVLERQKPPRTGERANSAVPE